MRCLVTGVCGFVGSHIAERLLKEGHCVRGVDSFTDYYRREIKEKNVAAARTQDGFELVEGDINAMPAESLLGGMDVVFHQAAQAGVRASWGESFQIYTACNVDATQRLLEGCKRWPVKRFVYASSSSIYGDTEDRPMRETSHPRPVSPYGVTKLAAEHLCVLYHKAFGIPTVSLRYFTVYGPRQRPDMAFHRFLRAAHEGRPISVYGDGTQTRDFTYVDDVVEANVRAMERKDLDGEVLNIGGGTTVELRKVLQIIEDLVGRKIEIRYVEKQKGDMRDTQADNSLARRKLGFAPRTSLHFGLEKEYRWLRECFGL